MLKATSLLIGAFLTLIVGMALLSSVSSLATDSITQKDSVVNESLTIPKIDNGTATYNDTINSSRFVTLSNVVTITKSEPITSLTLTLENGSVVLTEDTDYNFSATTGIIYFLEGGVIGEAQPDGSNLTEANYTYAANDYLTQSWARSTLLTVPGFFAIALLLVSVGLFFAVGKEWGLV